MYNKYKVGDKVIVISKINKHFNDMGMMDCYLGKIVTIKSVSDRTNPYRIVEDYGGEGVWNDTMFKSKVKQNRKRCKIE